MEVWHWSPHKEHVILVPLSKFAVKKKNNVIIMFLSFLCRNEGAIGFYKGIIPNVIRVTPACCITFLVYENVSRFLGQNKWGLKARHGQLQGLWAHADTVVSFREKSIRLKPNSLRSGRANVLMWGAFTCTENDWGWQTEKWNQQWILIFLTQTLF